MNTGTNKLTYHRFFTALFSILLIVFSFSGCGRISSVFSRSSEQETSEEENSSESDDFEDTTFYGNLISCRLKDSRKASLVYNLPRVPKSDDSMIYLFAFELYETCAFPENFTREPIASTKMRTRCELKWDFEREQLF